MWVENRLARGQHVLSAVTWNSTNASLPEAVDPDTQIYRSSHAVRVASHGTERYQISVFQYHGLARDTYWVGEENYNRHPI